MYAWYNKMLASNVLFFKNRGVWSISKDTHLSETSQACCWPGFGNFPPHSGNRPGESRPPSWILLQCWWHVHWMHLSPSAPEKYRKIYISVQHCCVSTFALFTYYSYIHSLILACCKENFKTTRESFSGCSFKTDLTTHSLIDNLSRVY